MAAVRSVVLSQVGGVGVLSAGDSCTCSSTTATTSGGITASIRLVFNPLQDLQLRLDKARLLLVSRRTSHSPSSSTSSCRDRTTLTAVECSARAFPMDVTEEAHQTPNDKEASGGRTRDQSAVQSLETSYATELKSLKSLYPKNRADDTSLQNPLLRQHRMGCGWLGVVLEWEGVVVEDDAELERMAWTALAEEEGRRPPPTFLLKRAEGMKNEQALSEVLCWTRDFLQLKRLARRKEELYEEMQKGTYRLLPGAREFVEGLKKFEIPIAIASTRPRKYIERAIEAVGMEGFFTEVIAAEDTYRGKPDPEMFQYASERLSIIPERCLVFGNSNSSVEAAHDALMKCVAIAGKHPVYELGAADLVVRRLDDLSMVDLKNLADLDSPEFRPPEPMVEMEEEEEPQQRVQAMKFKW
ncbi:hypothetical protein R1sor_018999 [Riccia sorocarpa]|uniref:Uncharacterized protein n=1 Tax=Riccia sorocarpa TaxID=122646 RepID=A0ABD3IFH9_9MARC